MSESDDIQWDPPQVTDPVRLLDLHLPYSGTIRTSLGSPVGPVVDLVAHPDGSVTWQYPEEGS